MALQGRPNKPQAVKDLQGNPGKRKANSDKPNLPTLRDVPSPPDFLPAIANAKWLEVAELLVTAGVLTGGDLHNLECFCLAYDRWRKAEADIEKNGITTGSKRKGFRKNPAVTIAGEAKRQLRDFSALLGLDPSSRERLHIPMQGQKPASVQNRFSALPGGKGKSAA